MQSRGSSRVHVVVTCLALGACGGGYAGPDLAEEVDQVVAAWESAYDSADLEQVQGVFTEDGVFFTSGDLHDLIDQPDEVIGQLGPDGQEFVRRFEIHQGDDLSVTDTVQVGDHAAAFRWAWQDFAAGTGTMSLRDGRLAAVMLTVSPSLVVPEEVNPVLEEFRRAASAGDVDRVRDLLADDVVVTTVAAAHAAYHADAVGADALADGSQLEAWLTSHAGEELAIVSPIQVGRGMAFVWGWSGGDAGTGTMDVEAQAEGGRITTVTLTDATTAIPLATPQ